MAWEYTTGEGSTWVEDMVGPQTDGTNVLSANAATIPTPTDTAGGAPAQYGQQILDLFKFGVGVAQQQANQQAFFDYKKFEATSGGLYRQGAPASVPKAATGSNSGVLLMAAAGIVLVILLTHKA